MRGWAALLLVFLCALSSPQSPTDAPLPPIHPQLVAYVRQHSSGANLIELSMVEPDYPPDLLQRQINDLCTRLEYPARGLQVYQEELVANNPNLRFLKATFATGNLTQADGTINLTPLAQAFAGAPAPHTIKGMTVIFDDFMPTKKTLKNYRSPSVSVEGRLDVDPPTVEYQIQLLSQNPSEISVHMEPPPVERTVSQPSQRTTPLGLIWGLIIVAGLAAGALVYFVLIRRPFGTPPNRAPRSRQ